MWKITLAQVECDVIRVAMSRLIRRHSLNWFPELFTNVFVFCITIAGVIILSVQEAFQPHNPLEQTINQNYMAKLGLSW